MFKQTEYDRKTLKLFAKLLWSQIAQNQRHTGEESEPVWVHATPANTMISL